MATAPLRNGPPTRPSPSTTPRSRVSTCATSSPRTRPAGERLTAEAVGLYLDYSKNRITDETLSLLFELARQSDLEQRRDMMFAGDRINVSENRSVLHVALRMPKGTSLVVDGVDVVAEVHEVLDRMAVFADRVRVGRVEGPHGQADPQHRQHRHRRLRPRSCHGVRGAAPLHAPRPRRSASSPTSTPPTSSRRRGISPRTRRSSSCRPRRSGRSRR